MTIGHPSETFQKMEGSLRPAQYAQLFRAFYLDCLRRVPGARLSSSHLATAYRGWAEEGGHPTISLKRSAAFMDRLGHCRLRSNGIHYRDVGLAVDYPHIAAQPLAEDMPEMGEAIAMMAQAAERIDQAISQLANLRASLDLCLPNLTR